MLTTDLASLTVERDAASLHISLVQVTVVLRFTTSCKDVEQTPEAPLDIYRLLKVSLGNLIGTGPTPPPTKKERKKKNLDVRR